ncbi:hypothetical protein PLICRDRAFT_51835 [Plicaturopsis crispa FD-325 SS-3]|nr:hypothetical protein PLICRDRAFT_51835 [Plicaturopsis crispa FD-325 SS-3]
MRTFITFVCMLFALAAVVAAMPSVPHKYRSSRFRAGQKGRARPKKAPLAFCDDAQEGEPCVERDSRTSQDVALRCKWLERFGVQFCVREEF